MLGGTVLSLTNPYWGLWWVTVGAMFLAETRSLGLGTLGITAFYLGHIISDYSWFSLVSLATASGRRIMNQATYRMVVILCGLFLWAMTVPFIVAGIKRAV